MFNVSKLFMGHAGIPIQLAYIYVELKFMINVLRAFIEEKNEIAHERCVFMTIRIFCL